MDHLVSIPPTCLSGQPQATESSKERSGVFVQLSLWGQEERQEGDDGLLSMMVEDKMSGSTGVKRGGGLTAEPRTSGKDIWMFSIMAGDTVCFYLDL